MGLRSKKRQDGLDAAYGERKSHEIKLRRFAYYVLKALGVRPSRGFPDYVEFYPPVRSAAEFADLSARVSCCLGDLGIPLYLPGERFELEPSNAPYMEPALVKDPGWVEAPPDGRSFLIVHRTTPKSVARLVTHRGLGAVNTDVNLFERSDLQYWTIRDRLAPPNYPDATASIAKLEARFADATKSFVLATGPSAKTVDLQSVAADVRITCNSAVQDDALLEAFKPNVLAFSDPVFHFGPSRYAAAFRRDMVNVAKTYDALLICGSDWVGPLLSLHPELEQNLCVIQHRDGGEWRWPTDAEPTVRGSISVLPNLMLPIALMLTDDVSVAGVDGRQPGENYFWKHGTQYSDDLMKSAFDAHPAFFRDREYDDFYDEYCEHLEEFISVAESRGKTVRGAAPSWIPAFRKRGASEPT
jgi:hypothetical protein